jgi:hypothetical protein
MRGFMKRKKLKRFVKELSKIGSELRESLNEQDGLVSYLHGTIDDLKAEVISVKVDAFDLLVKHG